MLRGLKNVFGRRVVPVIDPAVAARKLPDIATSVPIDSNRRQSKSSDNRPRLDASRDGTAMVPTTEAHPPAKHAAALLAWLQGPGGRSGTVLACDLEVMHRDLCQDHDWELVGWNAVGRELRRLLGARKEYKRRDGRQLCVYRIPPAHQTHCVSALPVQLVRTG